jgi:diguanylate cyclase (GGDEF)-like protein/PAS domain S-box-containing protein
MRFVNARSVLFFSTLIACVVFAVVVNVTYGIDIVYTHLFYVPIILAGIWYRRYALYVAAALGLIHIACDYAGSGNFKIESILRASIFIILAYVISSLASSRDRLLGELQMLNSAMLDMISRIDGSGVIQYVSPSVTAVLGYSPEQLTGKVLFDFIHPDEASSVKRQFQNAVASRTSFRVDYRRRRTNGEYLWIESLANPVFDSDKGVKGFVIGSRDITARKLAEEELKYLGVHDALTGLHNRALFDDELRRLDTGRFDPVGIVICDVDGLKLVNDHFGHEAGDCLLMTAASLLKDKFRASDVVARIGGDEFAVLLPACPPEMIREICDRLKQAMANRYIPDTKIPLMMSIGYATREGKSRSIEELLREADENMYREKIQNRKIFREIFGSVVSPS